MSTKLNKKRPWKKGPAITRVKLNPEQAVLGCCRDSGWHPQDGHSNSCTGHSCGAGTWHSSS
jgi:hypothetical protein